MRPDLLLVRFGIPALLLASCAGAAAVSLHTEPSEIPTFAFHSHLVLAVQLALLFFYAALLLLVPTVRALFDGDLPIELSLRGARWREELFSFSDNVVARLNGAAEEAEQADSDLREDVTHLKSELREVDVTLQGIADQLKERIVEVETKLMSREGRD